MKTRINLSFKKYNKMNNKNKNNNKKKKKNISLYN